MAEQKYSVLEKLGAGGMAEVWKGKASSLRGFEKLVAIKRILPGLAKDKQFTSMFLDEAKLALHLNHANIVQTFDIGVSARTYFIVMEWVDGMNLKEVLDNATASSRRIVVREAIYVVIEICKGLAHAHRRADADGNPLNIVHRDISPPNVLLSREGEVKIVDFGLAKAATQVNKTDPGMVKGKFSYLSPEAAFGKTVDYRADIFSAGLILYEMLAGKRAFQGENDLETVKQVRACKIPDARLDNDEVDDRLQEILAKSLAPDPDDRYLSALDMAHDLTLYLFARQLPVTSDDIAQMTAEALGMAAQRRAKPNLSSVFSPETANLESIGEELQKLTSIEDLERAEFQPMSLRGETAGVDAIDPRGWMSELLTEPTDPQEDPVKEKRKRLSQNRVKVTLSRAIVRRADQLGVDPTDPKRSRSAILADALERGLQQLEAEHRARTSAENGEHASP